MTGRKNQEVYILQKQSTVEINVEGGRICGCRTQDEAVNIFKGVPYAAPPVGPLRWKAPQPVEPWTGVRQCLSWEKAGMQPRQEPFLCWTEEFIIDDSAGYSEDCLFLNIWAGNDGEKKKPVIVYFHGGNFETGGSSCEIYDGEQIARAGGIFVSIDFRLGVLGLLAASVLSEENENNVSGNYQLLDQIAALRWIRNNIEQFGGDPENVTLFGQSSGACSVNYVAVSPLSKGLIRNVVALGHSTFTYPVRNYSSETGEHIFEHDYICKTLAEAEAAGDQAFRGLTAQQLRELPVEELLKFPPHLFPYCIDHYVLNGTFSEEVLRGATNDLNYITGFVDADNMLFSFMEPATKEEYLSDIRSFFGENAGEALRIYPPAEPFTFRNNGAKFDLTKAIVNDFLTADSLSLARAREKAGNKNTWLNVFNHTLPGPEAFMWGAFHTSEVPYYLSYFTDKRSEYWTDEDYALGGTMCRRLVNFAKTGDPNSDDLPVWERGIVYEIDSDLFEPKRTWTPEKEALWKKKYPVME